MDVHRWSHRSLLWAAALVLAALTLGMAFAHTLELPQKMGYGPSLWATLNQTLYQYFAVVGGPVEVLNVGVLVGLAVTERRPRPRSWGLLVAACCFGAALVVWFAVVQPGPALCVSSWPMTETR